MNEQIDAFVREKSTGIRHSGRGFYDHLLGTYDLLAGQPDYVRYAGFCHSIYGTNVFRIAAVPITTRKEVAEVIGADAERLAWIFCSSNRPHAFIRAARNGPPYFVDNRITDERIELSLQDISDLLTIEIANLREQHSYQILPEVQRAWRAVQELIHA